MVLWLLLHCRHRLRKSLWVRRFEGFRGSPNFIKLGYINAFLDFGWLCVLLEASWEVFSSHDDIVPFSAKRTEKTCFSSWVSNCSFVHFFSLVRQEKNIIRSKSIEEQRNNVFGLEYLTLLYTYALKDD